MFDSAPEGWRLRSLAQAAEAVLTGPFGSMLHEHDYVVGGTPVINPTNIQNGRIFADPAKTVSAMKKESLSTYVVRTGDILMGRRGEIGRCAAVSDAEDGWLCGTGCFIIRPGPTNDTSFLAALLGSADCRAKLTALASGITMLNLGNNALAAMELLLPPLAEQRRIADVLRSVDEAIAANRRVLDQAVFARAATLHAAFEECDSEPVKLGELGRWQSGGTPAMGDDTLWDGDIPWVCPRDMKTPVILRTDKAVSAKAIGRACKLVPAGTLLIVVRGMILAKAIPTATTAMEATFNQDIKAFHPNGRADPRFVRLCLQHQERSLLRLVNTATHGTKKLDTETLANVDVPLPGLTAQQELAEAVADMDLVMVRSGEEHIRLTTVKKAIQGDLLSGRVRIPG